MTPEALAKISTHSHYVTAFTIYPESFDDLQQAQAQLPAFRQLSRRTLDDAEKKQLKQHLRRGFMTLKLIKQIPLDNALDFAMTSALWLPVQAYYAVHGFGLAAHISLCGTSNEPRTHNGFINEAAERLVKGLLPDPFSVSVSAGFKGCHYLDPKLDGLEIASVSSGISNLSQPTLVTRKHHMYRCLSTTRERLIDEKLSRARARHPRPGKTRRNLRREEKRDIARGVPATTVFNYLYRIRLRSNYEDPELFLFEDDDREIALRFVIGVQEMAKRMCWLLNSVVETRLGPTNYEQLAGPMAAQPQW